MSGLAVVTPSYGPDAELFADLHRSVLEFTPEDTVHHVIVPPSDVARFTAYAGPRCRVWSESELLPARYRRSPRRGWWINLRRPWPPVRGWVLQQALKLALAAVLDVGAVLIADSDVVLVRPTEVGRFTHEGRLGLYRVDGAVHSAMDRHVRWHGVAARLLGLDPPQGLPLPDYVSSLNVWSPDVVRALQQRVSDVTGRSWIDAFTSSLHVSEFVLYGVFVDRIVAPISGPAPVETAVCLDYWDRVPLDERSAVKLADGLPPEAVGMMISAKSGTPATARRAAIARCAELVRGSAPARPGVERV